jgi:hypothetical protein
VHCSHLVYRHTVLMALAKPRIGPSNEDMLALAVHMK